MLKRVYSVEVVNENGTEKVLKAFQEYEDAKKYAMNHKEKLKENEYLNIIYTAYEFPEQKVIWVVGGWNEKETLEKEKNLQKATLKIKQKYGKNAILKGMNLEEGATTRERNEIIGGHKA